MMFHDVYQIAGFTSYIIGDIHVIPIKTDMRGSAVYWVHHKFHRQLVGIQIRDFIFDGGQYVSQFVMSHVNKWLSRNDAFHIKTPKMFRYIVCILPYFGIVSFKYFLNVRHYSRLYRFSEVFVMVTDCLKVRLYALERITAVMFIYAAVYRNKVFFLVRPVLSKFVFI